MGRDEQTLRRGEARGVDGLQPGLEPVVVDALALGGRRVADEILDARDDGHDLGRAFDVLDLGEGEHAFEDVLLVEGGRRVFHAHAAVVGVRVDSACVAVAREGCVPRHVLHARGVELVVQPALPLEPDEPGRGQHGDGFELGAVAFAVEVFEFADYRGEDGAFPGVDFFLVDASDDGDGVEMQIAADVVVFQAGAQEEERGLHRAASDDDAFGLDDYVSFRDGLTCYASVDVSRGPGTLNTCSDFLAASCREEDPLGVETFDELGTSSSCIWEEAHDWALLFAGTTSKGAVAAVVSRATCVLWHRFMSIAQFACAFHQNLIAAVLLDEVCGDAHASADTVERVLEFSRGEEGKASLRPLFPHEALRLK